MNRLRLGTRGSQLALYQAHTVAELLGKAHGLDCEVVVIKTSGDHLAEAALSQIGGKRVFVKEIEDALLAGELDLAVHSSKDMPAALPDGLRIAGVLPREDARDAMVLPADAPAVVSLEDVARHLGREPRLGTSSVRRSAQLTRLFPGARFVPVRGNIDTRLRKLDSGTDFDALVLASAGLRRLQRGDRVSAALPVDACVPAPGQGIIAVEVRSDDRRTSEIVHAIDHAASSIALAAERAVVTRLGGGCQMPIGAYAAVDGGEVCITAVVVSLDGSQAARADARGRAAEAQLVGVQVADDLLTRGAAEILAEVQRAPGAVEGLQP